MHPETGTVAGQAPELLLIQFAVLVPRRAFQHMAGHVLSLRLDILGHTVRQRFPPGAQPLGQHHLVVQAGLRVIRFC